MLTAGTWVGMEHRSSEEEVGVRHDMCTTAGGERGQSSQFVSKAITCEWRQQIKITIQGFNVESIRTSRSYSGRLFWYQAVAGGRKLFWCHVHRCSSSSHEPREPKQLKLRTSTVFYALPQ